MAQMDTKALMILLPTWHSIFGHMLLAYSPRMWGWTDRDAN